MKPSPYGPCGLFCGACGADDCDGCLSERIDEYVRQCRFRVCTRNKGLDFCCHCEDYPCSDLAAFMGDKWPHHWTMEPNLEFIRSQGVAQWLEAQRREWLCPKCGAEIVWYQKQCPCGQELDAFEVPE
ncbi:MAG: DUF3795 domain-containing protein [Sedimentisphaerales bacterium]|jgi:hypothetical protein|nr:DUF3795 domain-containing protein [Sedimentisphaerales bacterium]NLT76132.1 DUF3795 domain-containing protein [Planctomycetota bacterium]